MWRRQALARFKLAKPLVSTSFHRDCSRQRTWSLANGRAFISYQTRYRTMCSGSAAGSMHISPAIAIRDTASCQRPTIPVVNITTNLGCMDRPKNCKLRAWTRYLVSTGMTTTRISHQPRLRFPFGNRLRLLSLKGVKRVSISAQMKAIRSQSPCF